MISNAKHKLTKLKELVSPRARRSDKPSKSKDNKKNAESTVNNALSQPSSKSSDQSAENPKRRASLSVEKIESPRRIDDCDLDTLFTKFECEHKTLGHSDLLKSFPWIVRLDYPNVSPEALSAFMNDKNKEWAGRKGKVPVKENKRYSREGCEMLNRVGRHQFYEKFNEIPRDWLNSDASGRLEANSETNKIIQSFITSVANEIRTPGFKTRWTGAEDARDAIRNFDMAAKRHQQFGAEDWSELCSAIENLGEFKQWNNRAGSPENRDLKSPRKMPAPSQKANVSPRRVPAFKPTTVAGTSPAPVLNAQQKAVMDAITEKAFDRFEGQPVEAYKEVKAKGLKNGYDAAALDAYVGSDWSLRARMKSEGETSPKAERTTSFSLAFRDDFHELLNQHQRRPNRDGTPYIPGRNGFPFLRGFINMELTRNPRLANVHGREKEAFFKLKNALDKLDGPDGPDVNDEKAATAAWVHFREVVTAYFNMRQTSNQPKGENRNSVEVKSPKLDSERFNYMFQPNHYGTKAFLMASLKNNIDKAADFEDAIVRVKDDVSKFKNGIISPKDISEILDPLRRSYQNTGKINWSSD